MTGKLNILKELFAHFLSDISEDHEIIKRDYYIVVN